MICAKALSYSFLLLYSTSPTLPSTLEVVLSGLAAGTLLPVVVLNVDLDGEASWELGLMGWGSRFRI